MCGIGFVSKAPGSDLPVRPVTRWMLHQLAPRGRDAAGVAWKRPDATTLYRKLPGHPVRLAAHLAAVSGSRSLDRSNAVIVHTRWSTVGSPSIETNNHPIVRPGVALAHNGTIDNAAELYDLTGLAALADVDSDAIAALVEAAPDMDTLLDWFEQVRGLASLAWLDVTDHRDDRDAVMVARLDTRPMVVATTPAGDVLGASTEGALRSVARDAGVKLASVTHLPEGAVMRVDGGRIVETWQIATGSGQAESVAEYEQQGLAV